MLHTHTQLPPHTHTHPHTHEKMSPTGSSVAFVKVGSHVRGDEGGIYCTGVGRRASEKERVKGAIQPRPIYCMHFLGSRAALKATRPSFPRVPSRRRGAIQTKGHFEGFLSGWILTLHFFLAGCGTAQPLGDDSFPLPPPLLPSPLPYSLIFFHTLLRLAGGGERRNNLESQQTGSNPNR